MRHLTPFSTASTRLILIVALLLGLLPVAALAAPLTLPPSQETPAAAPEIFISDVLPAASSPGRLLTLILNPAGDATLSNNYLNGEAPIVEIGTWSEDDAEGALLVRLSGTEAAAYAAPVELAFAREADGSLSLVEWDASLYGSEGFALSPAPNTEFAGAWASDILPAASSPGRDIRLQLSYDGSASLSTDYLDGEDPVVELGMWSIDDGGALAVSFTGRPDTVYEAPVEWLFALEGDMLTATEWDASLYGSTALALRRVDLEITPEESPYGVWVSNVLPAASSPGQVVLLILYMDGSLQSSTWYLDNGLPVIEDGTWVHDGDDTVTVIVTGSTERQYDTPQELAFTWDGETLRYLSLTLTRLPEQGVAPIVEPVAFFTSGVTPAASSPGIQRSLILFDDGSARLITDYLTGDEPITEVGVWEGDDAGNLLLELTGRPGKDYTNPVAITFAQEGTTLTSTEWDRSLYGSEGLSLEEQNLDELLLDAEAPLTGEATDLPTGVPAAVPTDTLTTTVGTEADATAELLAAAAPFETPAGAQAVFVSDLLPAASSPGRLIRLVLFEDGTCQMVSDYLNGEAPILEVGTWEESAAGELVVALNGQFLATPYAEPDVFTFARAENTLTAVEWDESLHGSEPLTLTVEAGE